MKNVMQIAKLTTIFTLASFTIDGQVSAMNLEDAKKIVAKPQPKEAKEVQVARAIVQLHEDYEKKVSQQQAESAATIESLQELLDKRNSSSTTREQQIREGMGEFVYGAIKGIVAAVWAWWDGKIDTNDGGPGVLLLHGIDDARKGSEKILNIKTSDYISTPWKS